MIVIKESRLNDLEFRLQQVNHLLQYEYSDELENEKSKLEQQIEQEKMKPKTEIVYFIVSYDDHQNYIYHTNDPHLIYRLRDWGRAKHYSNREEAERAAAALTRNGHRNWFVVSQEFDIDN